MVALRRMTPSELTALLEVLVPDYAAENARAGRWSAEQAPARAREEIDHLIPQGVETADQFLWVILDRDGGHRVGELWLALDRSTAPHQLFIYWIGIDPAHRRHGYGAAALGAVEDECRRLGAGRVALHVFGTNTTARALYERAGYTATSLFYAKDVPPSGAAR